MSEKLTCPYCGSADTKHAIGTDEDGATHPLANVFTCDHQHQWFEPDFKRIRALEGELADLREATSEWDRLSKTHGFTERYGEAVSNRVNRLKYELLCTQRENESLRSRLEALEISDVDEIATLERKLAEAKESLSGIAELFGRQDDLPKLYGDVVTMDRELQALRDRVAAMDWVCMDDRLPTKNDGNKDGMIQVWLEQEGGTGAYTIHWQDAPRSFATHWRKGDNTPPETSDEQPTEAAE